MLIYYMFHPNWLSIEKQILSGMPDINIQIANGYNVLADTQRDIADVVVGSGDECITLLDSVVVVARVDTLQRTKFR
ncbi:Hypothetical predicted protein [Octopus vulgaris]|uniref:Uncharacterized protein n=1 Tax=Octopus vulgaris TaxID=6645 RepID=A0AA36B295_OCTVU|nr:Hypothetical predicted protein [Octopus vulgaris]